MPNKTDRYSVMPFAPLGLRRVVTGIDSRYFGIIHSEIQVRSVTHKIRYSGSQQFLSIDNWIA